MTQQELKQKVLAQIKALGTIRAFNQSETENPFQGVVNRKDAYFIARGMFEKVSKKQIDALEYYFLKLENDKEMKDKSNIIALILRGFQIKRLNKEQCLESLSKESKIKHARIMDDSVLFEYRKKQYCIDFVLGVIDKWDYPCFGVLIINQSQLIGLSNLLDKEDVSANLYRFKFIQSVMQYQPHISIGFDLNKQNPIIRRAIRCPKGLWDKNDKDIALYEEVKAIIAHNNRTCNFKPS